VLTNHFSEQEPAPGQVFVIWDGAHWRGMYVYTDAVREMIAAQGLTDAPWVGAPEAPGAILKLEPPDA
jgi:hypothetical protein